MSGEEDYWREHLHRLREEKREGEGRGRPLKECSEGDLREIVVCVSVNVYEVIEGGCCLPVRRAAASRGWTYKG